jgi:serine/threonine-protein kinase
MDATPPPKSRPPVDSPVPQSLGAAVQYDLLKVHAQGGLGRVWSAVDSRLKREVAIKELLPKHGDDTGARRRFLLEAQVTGLLTHPHIVPIYHLGIHPESGHPYYVMRMLRGQTLRSAISQARNSEGGMSRSDLRRLVSGFVSVCNALAYANARGVVHRDLKPDNVVLGDYGEVLVIDWGLAKVAGHEEELHDEMQTGPLSANETIQGSVLGTPIYMAPEQAAGQLDRIDHRTDVFGLGGILFEILTGQPPHERAPAKELIKRVASSPCRRPRDVDPRVPAALDAICGRAMMFQPDQRYADATQLARDVELWLAGEPVSVYREPWVTRAGRWARRHRTLVTTSVALLIASVVGLAVNSWLVGQEQRRTSAARDRAEKNLQSARQAVDLMLTRVAEEDLENVPRMESLRRELFQRASNFYQGFAEDSPNDPDLRIEVAEAYERVGDIAIALGDPDEAQAAYRKSIEALESLDPASAAADDVRLRLGRTLDSFGEVARKSGNLSLAEQRYQRAIELLRTADPGNPAALSQYARACYNRGLLFIEQGRPKEAEESLKESIDCFEDLIAASDPAGSSQDGKEHRQGLARAYINLGLLLRGQGESQRGEAAYRKAVALLRALLDENPQSQQYRYELATVLLNLGNALLGNSAQLQEAESRLRESREQLALLVQDYPDTPNYLKGLANANNSLGSLCFNDRRREDTEQAWREASDLFTRLISIEPGVPEHLSLAALNQNNLAHLSATRRDFQAAYDFYTAAVQLQQQALDATPNQQQRRTYLRQHYRGLAEVCLELRRGEEARDAARRLCALDDTPANDHYRAARFLARSLPLLALQAGASSEQADEQRRQLVDEVVAKIERALAAGFSDRDDLDKQPDFEELRTTPQFAELVARAKNAAK